MKMQTKVFSGFASRNNSAVQGAAACAAALFAGWTIIQLARSGDPHLEDLALTALLGIGLGIVFQRTRFCILCMLRDAVTQQNFKPVLGLLLTIAVGSAGYLVVFGAWIPDPGARWLPPNAFIGPIGIHLVIGGLLFGLGMALSGSCISSHMYRSAEGNSSSWITLVSIIPGFILGYLSWDFWYLNSIQQGTVIWLPEHFGYSGAALLQFGGIAVLAVLLLKFHRNPVRTWLKTEPESLTQRLHALLKERWPVNAGAVAIGGIAVAAYFRLRPLGVTSELSRYSRNIGQSAGFLQQTVYRGLDAIAGCIPQEAAEILSQNGVLITALTAGSLVSVLAAGKLNIKGTNLWGAFRAVTGGILLGYGAMISLGCSIGTFLSGTMAFSLSGWLFGAAMLAGVLAGFQLLRLFSVEAGCSVPSGPVISSPTDFGTQFPDTENSRYNPSLNLPDSGYVSPAQLSSDIHIIIDAGRSREEFTEGHIPGAVWLDFRYVYRPQKNRSGMFALDSPTSHDQSLPDNYTSGIVIYDQGNGQRASRAAIGLHLAGWKNISVLNGGINSWAAYGKPLEAGSGSEWQPHHQHINRQFGNVPINLANITGDHLQMNLKKSVIVDTRRISEYSGIERRASRAGHIPGALHWEWKRALRDGFMELKDIAELHKEFLPIVTMARKQEIQQVIFYCHSGLRASHTAWLFSHMYPQFQTVIYDASWEEWGRNRAFPVEI
ncbi:YeeE/YedE thiosulfate transporter family protein [Spirochaeta dissipatitropha]